MSDFFDKFIADLVKGASSNLRENGGPGVNIVVSRENRGHEEKLANQGGIGALLGSLGSGMGAMGPLGPLNGQAGAAIGAGLGADPGRGLEAAITAGAGHGLGDLAGGALGNLMHLSPEAINTMRQISAMGGGTLGGHFGGKDDRGMIERIRGKHGAEEKRASSVLPMLLGGTAGHALGGAGLGALVSALRGDGHMGRDALIGAGLGGAGGATAATFGRGGLDMSLNEVGRALTATPGRQALLGAGLGGLAGAVANGDNPLGGAAQGAAAGAGLGAIHGKLGALEERYTAGTKAAATALGIKEAFLPILGAIAGPTLARLGLGRLAAGAGGRALGGLAGKVAPRVAGGLGGAAFDQAAGMAGGALGQKLMPQQPQPQPMMG